MAKLMDKLENLVIAVLLDGRVPSDDGLYHLNSLDEVIKASDLSNYGRDTENGIAHLRDVVQKHSSGLIQYCSDNCFEFRRPWKGEIATLEPADGDSEITLYAKGVLKQFRKLLALKMDSTDLTWRERKLLAAERQMTQALLEQLRQIQGLVGNAISELEDGGK